jgi:hypothetical protein
MKFMCAVDNTPCGAGASKVCADQHEKCTARYIKEKRREEREERREEWKS